MFNVIVKVSYKISGINGNRDKEEKVKIETDLSSYESALDRAAINIIGLSQEMVENTKAQKAAFAKTTKNSD